MRAITGPRPRRTPRTTTPPGISVTGVCQAVVGVLYAIADELDYGIAGGQSPKKTAQNVADYARRTAAEIEEDAGLPRQQDTQMQSAS